MTEPARETPAPRLEVTFLGTTTVMLKAGKSTVMTDGYFSRPSIGHLLFTRLEPNEARIEDALTKGNVGDLKAVFVAHSHHDHAMDSAKVACKKKALLVGSASTRNIAVAEGFPEERIVIPELKRATTYGAFEVTVFDALHSPNPLRPGTIDTSFTVPAHVFSYKEGGSYTFLVSHPSGKVLIQPSANFIEGALDHIRADVVFLSIGRLGLQDLAFARDYWRHVVKATEAKLVIPTHWDDIALPLSKPLGYGRRLIDDAEGAMRILELVARENGIPLLKMDAFDSIDIQDALKAHATATAK